MQTLEIGHFFRVTSLDQRLETGQDQMADAAAQNGLLAKQIGFPAWVEVAVEKAEGTFKKVPDRDEFAADINESLIVELYSR